MQSLGSLSSHWGRSPDAALHVTQPNPGRTRLSPVRQNRPKLRGQFRIPGSSHGSTRVSPVDPSTARASPIPQSALQCRLPRPVSGISHFWYTDARARHRSFACHWGPDAPSLLTANLRPPLSSLIPLIVAVEFPAQAAPMHDWTRWDRSL